MGIWYADGAARVPGNTGRSLLMALGIAACGTFAGPVQAIEWQAPKPSREESLLIATREASPADEQATGSAPKSGDALEPISQTPERVPEVASQLADEDRSGEAFRAGLIGNEPERVAARVKPSIRRAPPVEKKTAKLESVKFRGILAGATTKAELLTAWGEPARQRSSDDGHVLAYDVHPFEIVDVLVDDAETVSAIKIALAKPLEAKNLAKQLELDSFRPAIAKNEFGQALGHAFPERGVLFVFEASESDALASDDAQPLVSHVVIHPVEAESFAMRVENQPDGLYEKNIQDLKTALELEPEFARAHCLLARAYLATGQADLAESAATTACEIEPKNAAYQLCLAASQEQLGDYDKAVLTVRAVLDDADVPAVDRAAALQQMAHLASLGDVEIATKSITFYNRAIEIADSLATSTNAEERRAAKRILIESHLAVAEEIGRQPFSNKIENISMWIGRASGIAEECIDSGDGGLELRLLVAQRALAALATFRPTVDPAPWVAEAQETADALLARCDDKLWQARVKWELGTAYFHALRVDHMRRETAPALRHGLQAVEYLAAGATARQAVHASEQIVGQLYYQIGAVHAVHQLDHAKAAPWYEKAEPLLTCPRPVSELYSPRREGEMLVSMGVSFWQLGDQDRALELTQSGVNLVELAVEDGILARTALAVPYGNLATMYRQLGQDKNAAKYAELARSVSNGKAMPAQPPRLSRSPATGRQPTTIQTQAQQRQPARSLR